MQIYIFQFDLQKWIHALFFNFSLWNWPNFCAKVEIKTSPFKKSRHAPNIGAPKYIKKILENFKKDIDSNTIIVGDFNTLLSKKDRSPKQNINKDIVTLNNALDEMDLSDIYRESLSSQRSKIHILFKYTWNIFKDRSYDKTQNKPQQIQENWNHIKHFFPTTRAWH